MTARLDAFQTQVGADVVAGLRDVWQANNERRPYVDVSDDAESARRYLDDAGSHVVDALLFDSRPAYGARFGLAERSRAVDLYRRGGIAVATQVTGASISSIHRWAQHEAATP